MSERGREAIDALRKSIQARYMDGPRKHHADTYRADVGYLLGLMEDMYHEEDVVEGRTVRYCKEGKDPQTCPASIKPDMECGNLFSVCASRGSRPATIKDLIRGKI